ncbi:VTT domain-containing protein [Nonomuraea sp. NPDC050310]|uniref:DedA family protein n=1 Tax=unclassified Nonomuraea TaxID=2593643 RepID=UPI0033F1C989
MTWPFPRRQAGMMLIDLLDLLARQEAGVVWPLLLAFLTLDASVGVGLVIPGDGLLLVAGTTADSPWEVAGLTLAGVSACFLGASAGHWLGRRYGRRLREGRLGRRVGEERWAQAESLFARSGWAVALAYFLPVVHALTPAVAGMLGVPYRRFLPWAMAGAVSWVGAYLTLGAAAGQVVREHAELLIPVLGTVVLVITAGSLLARRVFRVRRAAGPRRG